MSLSTTAFLGYYSARNALEEQVKEKVVAIADAREQHLLDFLDLNKKTITAFSTDGFILENMEDLRENTDDYNAIIDDLNKQLDIKISLRSDFYELFIMDNSGIVVASTDRSKIGNDESYDDYFIEGKKRFFIKDAYFYEKHSKKSMVFSHSLRHQLGPEHSSGAPSHFVGVIAVRLETSGLNEIISGTAHKEALTMSQGLGKASEVYLVNKDGLMLAPLKFKEDALLKQRVDTLPVQKCLSERKEIIDIYPNYMGETVIGASMCIPSMNWTLLTEISAKEAFAPVIIFRNEVFVLSIFIVLIAMLFVFFIVKKISNPIKILAEKAQEISKGNFDQKIRIKADDEIGILAQEFNKMTASLKQKSDELIKNKEKYRVLVQTSPDCIKLFNLNGKILFINEGGLKEHRLKDFEEAKKWDYMGGVIKEDQEKFKKAIKDATEGKTTTIEIRHTHEGSIRNACLETIAPVKNEKGEIYAVFGVSRDITEKNKTEEELRRFNKLAIDRELKMIELKQKIKDLENKND